MIRTLPAPNSLSLPVFLLLQASEKLSELFRRFVRTFPVCLVQAALVFQYAGQYRRQAYGEADEDHDRNPLAFDSAKPKFRTRLVSAMPGQRRDDRLRQRWGDLKPGSPSRGEMAQLGRVAPFASGRWLSSDLSEFTARSPTEHKTR